jgi:hypothetical protein
MEFDFHLNKVFNRLRTRLVKTSWNISYLIRFLVYENPYDLVPTAVQTVNWKTTGHPGVYSQKNGYTTVRPSILKYDYTYYELYVP